MDHFNFKINSVFHQNQLLSPRGCCWVSMSVDDYHKSHKIQGARYSVSWEPPLCLQPKEVTITWQYRSSGQYAKNKWIYKIVKHIEKDIFCLANTQSVSSPHSGPCPCPYPPMESRVCVFREASLLCFTHIFSLSTFCLSWFPQFGPFALTNLLSVHTSLKVSAQAHILPIVLRVAIPKASTLSCLRGELVSVLARSKTYNNRKITSSISSFLAKWSGRLIRVLANPYSVHLTEPM